MVSGALRDLLRTLPSTGRGILDSLSGASPGILSVSGTGIMLMTDDVQRGSLRTTDAVSARIEDLQFEFHEGPCVDAYLEQRPILEPDLVSPDVARWPDFTPPAIEAGVGAVFGFPLAVGPVRLGSLNLYRRTAGRMDEVELGDAGRLADLLAIEVLNLQADAEAGEVSSELRANADLQDRVHQACGMVAIQLDVPVAQALRVLLAHARAGGRPLQDVCNEVVARRLRFDGDEREVRT